MTLSRTNFPTLRFSHGLLNRLSTRTHEDSNPASPVFSNEVTSKNEMLLYRVSTLRMSQPVRSNPLLLIWVSPVRAPSTATLITLSRCQYVVMRNATGQYDGFCQTGES